MGGSGGRGYFSSDPKKVAQELQASQDTTDAQEFDALCNQTLQSYLAEFNSRDAEEISRRLEQIKEILSEDIEGTIDLRFGGSVAKHTFVNGLSDVDSLVLINKSDLADLTPDQAKEFFLARLKGGLPDATVTQGDLAVTIDFGDLQIQLLPALKTRGGYRIANPDGGWSDIRPQEFTRALTASNEHNGFKLVPTIKLAKAIVDNLPDRQRLKSYHVEALAIEAFGDYKGSQNYKDMLLHFFSEASSRVGQPLKDPTGQSAHLDEYLGPTGSLERRLVADALDRVARRIKNADIARSLDQIKGLFD